MWCFVCSVCLCVVSVCHIVLMLLCGARCSLYIYFLFLQLLRGQFSPQRTHLYSLVQLVFVCPILLQFVHCSCFCVLSRYLSPVVEIWFILCWDVSYLRKAVYIKKIVVVSCLCIVLFLICFFVVYCSV